MRPEAEQAFICNREEHWFSLRRLDGQWWDLNSTQPSPSKLSETYLGAFLAQCVLDGRGKDWQR